MTKLGPGSVPHVRTAQRLAARTWHSAAPLRACPPPQGGPQGVPALSPDPGFPAGLPLSQFPTVWETQRAAATSLSRHFAEEGTK